MLREGRSFSGLERNCVFLNTFGNEKSQQKFANISAVSGFDFPDDCRALCHVDWDNDGDLDIWVTNRNQPRLRLLRNESDSTNQFVQIAMTGNGQDANRNAIGGRVTIYLKNRDTNDGRKYPDKMVQTVYAGDGFLSQGTRWLQFGLGPDAQIEKVEAHWPNAESTTEVFTGIEVNGRYELVQGTGQATDRAIDRSNLVLKPSVQEAKATVEKHRIPVIFNIPAPAITYLNFDGQKKVVQRKQDQSVLINLWSSTCRPCIKELTEFRERRAELEKAGLRVLAISIDELTCEVDDPLDSSKKLAERLQIPFEHGMADPALIEQLQIMHSQLINLDRPLPLPSSFLINREGNVDVIYKGAVTVDTLLQDVKFESLDLKKRFLRSAAFPGRSIGHPISMEPLQLEASIVHLRRGREALNNGQIQNALVEYKLAMEINPESPFAHNDYALALKLDNQVSESVPHFRKAVQQMPSQPQFRVNLAQSYISLNRDAEAEEQLQTVIRKIPKHSDAHFYLGVIAMKRRDVQAAQQKFEQAVKCNRRHGRAHFSLGNLFVQQNKLDQARQSFLQTLSIDANDPVVLVSLAQVEVRAKNFEEASEYSAKAVQIQPNYPEAHYVQGVSQLQLGSTDKAIESFRETLKYNPNHQAAIRAITIAESQLR